MTDRILYPDPIKNITIKSQPDDVVESPGEYELSEQEELLKKAIVYDGITRDLIEGYNDIIEDKIPKSIKSSKIRVLTSSIREYYSNKKLKYSENKDLMENINELGIQYRPTYKRELFLIFLDVVIESPKDSNGRPLYPYHFLSKKKSYMATIKVKLGIEVRSKHSSTIIPLKSIENGSEWIPVGDIPILTGSILDNIEKLPKEEDPMAYGVNPADPRAEYIISGDHYMVFLKDTQRLNRIFCYLSKNRELCIMTNTSYTKTEQTVLVNDEIGRIYYRVSKDKSINVFTFAQLVLQIKPEELLKRIQIFSKKKYWTSINNYLQITLEDNESNTNIVKTFAKVMETTESDLKDESKARFYEIKYRNYFDEKLYPNVNTKGYTKDYARNIKINILTIQISRLAEFANGYRKADDRDSWANKSILGSPVSIIQQFNGVWNSLKSVVEEGINASVSGKSIKESQDIKSPENIRYYQDIFREAISKLRATNKNAKTDLKATFERNFLNNKWGSGYSQENGRTERIEAGENLLSKYSFITKINSPVNEKTSISVKLPRADQLGYVGIVETPETQKCGLRRNKAVTCWISVDRDSSILEQDIINASSFKTETNGLSSDTTCMVNGLFLGWCDGPALRKIIIQKRRKEMIAKDVSVVYDSVDNFLYVHTDRSRPTRPLLIVDKNNELIIDKKNLWKADFKTLLSEGAVEYVDSWEIDFKDITIAKNFDTLFNHKRAIKYAQDYLIYLETLYISKGGVLDTTEGKKNFYSNKIDQIKTKLNQLQQQKQSYIQELQVIDKTKHDNLELLKKLKQEYLNLNELDPSLITTQNKKKALQDTVYTFGLKLLDTEYRIQSTEDINEIIYQYKLKIDQDKDSISRNLEYIKNRYSLYQNKNKKYQKSEKINPKEYVNDLLTDYNDIFQLINNIIEFPTIEELDTTLNELRELQDSHRDRHIAHFDSNIRTHFYKKLQKELNLYMTKLDHKMKQLRRDNINLSSSVSAADKKQRKTFINTIALNGQIITKMKRVLSIIERIKNRYIYMSPKEIKNSTNIKLKDLKKHIKVARDTYTRISKLIYSYAELSPNALLGVSASTLPAINLNEGVRNSYAASMNKQALASTTASDLFNFSKEMKRLAHSQRPIYEPMINKMIGMDTAPNGENVKLAIMDWKNNREDSIVVSKRAIDNGMFMMQIYKSFFEELKKKSEEGANVKYYFGKPPLATPKKRIYDNLDERGVAMVGSIIKVGQVIIGKYMVITDKIGRKQINDISVKALDESMTGIVDRAFVSKNINENAVASVRLRTIRPAIVGDKFATRSAQKSIISAIIPDVDMPFTSLGDTPDVIMNTLAIPSRMTVNQLVEMIASKHGVLKGTRENATGFRKINYEEWGSTLLEYGFDSGGYETFYDGISGEVIKGKVFFGPVYYRALKHHVVDKIQYRAFGQKDPMTRGPPGGRTGGGGLRLGEMEQSALRSHGADMVLLERMCTSSTEIYTAMCISCSSFAQMKGKEFKCGVCGRVGIEGFGRIKIPFTFKLFQDHMAVLGNLVKFEFKEK